MNKRPKGVHRHDWFRTPRDERNKYYSDPLKYCQMLEELAMLRSMYSWPELDSIELEEDLFKKYNAESLWYSLDTAQQKMVRKYTKSRRPYWHWLSTEWDPL